jgi:hypothetical protein
MLKSYVPSKVQEEFKMNEIAKVTNTMEETIAAVDFLGEIRVIVKDLEQLDAYNAALDYVSKTEGAMRWLYSVKRNSDHIVVTRKFEFNASDMLGDCVSKRVKALEKVAYDVNLADVLNELEALAWCCRLD